MEAKFSKRMQAWVRYVGSNWQIDLKLNETIRECSKVARCDLFSHGLRLDEPTFPAVTSAATVSTAASIRRASFFSSYSAWDDKKGRICADSVAGDQDRTNPDK